jgi:hypothetical protein
MFSPALPLKDTLRGLRNGLETGRNLIRPLQEKVPVPVNVVMRDILTRADSVGARMDRATSQLAHLLLDHPETRDFRGWTLTRMAADPAGPTIFAERLYHGLEIAFERLSLPPELFSEVLAARAFEQALRPAPEDGADLAAGLLLHAEGRLFAQQPPFARRARPEDRRLALFGVLLWLLAERDSDTEEDALLDVCIDAAAAVGREVADLPGSRAEVRQLLSHYVRLV